MSTQVMTQAQIDNLFQSDWIAVDSHCDGCFFNPDAHKEARQAFLDDGPYVMHKFTNQKGN